MASIVLSLIRQTLSIIKMLDICKNTVCLYAFSESMPLLMITYLNTLSITPPSQQLLP
jgi:hypothetical protein